LLLGALLTRLVGAGHPVTFLPVLPFCFDVVENLALLALVWSWTEGPCCSPLFDSLALVVSG
jgi:hypothetical protein